MSNGRTANERGKMLEDIISRLLEQGYQRVQPRHFFDYVQGNQTIFARQCSNVGKDIYGRDRRVDFILYHPERWPDGLIIQCKAQNVGGTVDQKYPFEVASIHSSNHKAIIVYSGGGHSEGAEKWLRAQAGTGNLVATMNLEEFADFVKTELKR